MGRPVDDLSFHIAVILLIVDVEGNAKRGKQRETDQANDHRDAAAFLQTSSFSGAPQTSRVVQQGRYRGGILAFTPDLATRRAREKVVIVNAAGGRITEQRSER
eukprot:m.347818 g.347818  ORF g.347818 m.347818 type:complete len:104 (-) comp55858_c0_seq10:112-423(-)